MFTVITTGFAALWAIDRYEIESQIDYLRNGIEIETVIGSGGSVDDDDFSIHQLSWSMERVNRQLWFIRINARLIGWVPFIGSNFRAGIDLFDQGHAMVKSSEELFLAFDALAGVDSKSISFRTFRNVGEFEQLVLSVGNARDHLAKSIEQLNTAPDYSGSEPPLIIGPLRSQMRNNGEYYDQLKEITTWSYVVMSGLESVMVNSTGMVSVVGSLSSREGGSVPDSGIVTLAYEQFLAGVEQADGYFNTASESMPSLLDRSAYSGDIEAGFRIFHALRTPLENSIELVLAASRIADIYYSPDTGRLTEGLLIRTVASELSGLEQFLNHEYELLVEFRSVLNEEGTTMSDSRQALVSDFDQRLSEALSVWATVGAFAGDVEKLVGTGSNARYLLLGANSDEIRASGGFISNVWVLEFADGALVDPEPFDVVGLDNLDILDQYSPADPALQIHMSAPVILMRDVSWDPHFPEVASEAVRIFELSGGDAEFQGVIVLNQNVFASLMVVLGESRSDEGGITFSMALESLKTGTDVFGRSFVDEVITDFVSDLGDTADSETIVELAKSIAASFRSRNIQMFLINEKLQQRLEFLGIAGTMPVTSQDRFYVVDSNVGWSKSNQFVTRSTDYSIDLAQPEPKVDILINYQHGGSRKSQEIDLVKKSEFANEVMSWNFYGEDITLQTTNDDLCGDQFQFDVLDYEQLGNRCYWNFVRVYVPDGSVFDELPYLPMPLKSVAVQTGRAREGEDSSSVIYGNEGVYATGLMKVPAGETIELRYKYSPPGSIVQHEDGLFTYSLLLSPQPGIIDEKILINVSLPDTASITYSSHPLVTTINGTMKADLTLSETIEFVVKYVLLGS
ncbi:MAG: DUF4012 domain-containing protein [Chloroflexi bacterium]|nr:DUF4012 domain-containing protein [Chloroflexota bacterium]